MRENKRGKIALAAKALGGIAFLSVLFLNVTVLRHNDGKAAHLSVISLKSYADSGSGSSSSGSGSSSSGSGSSSSGSGSGSSSSSSSSSSGGDSNRICGIDDCEIIRDIGVPPYHVNVTYKGHYIHCQVTMDATKHCTSSNCDSNCDA
ncbi:hypothetical protein [Mucilaginibacter sp.]|uniref:hypothetical protein n=1 Tax=Mucilaginibacter sp. TaxID=1882438 RepID=UPI002ED5A319